MRRDKSGIAYVDVGWRKRSLERLADMAMPDEPEVMTHWEPDHPDVPHEYTEQAEFDEAEAAIEWARERAPMVLVRVGNSEDDVYSAGERPATRELPEYGGTDLREYPPWPPRT